MEILVVAVTAFGALALLGFIFRSFEIRIHELSGKIAKLEAAQQNHLPFRAAENIEEATANILRARQELELVHLHYMQESERLELIGKYAGQALHFTQQARTNRRERVGNGQDA